VEGRNKEGHARTEREILEAVDHPFLPRLYGVAKEDRWSCLLTEFCPGGDLHVLRQRQPHRRFSEATVRYDPSGRAPITVLIYICDHDEFIHAVYSVLPGLLLDASFTPQKMNIETEHIKRKKWEAILWASMMPSSTKRMFLVETKSENTPSIP
jgi:hypothetical protein